MSTPAAPGWEDSHPASWSPPTGEPGRTRENQDGEGRSLYSYHVKICIYMILYKNIVIIMLLSESMYIYIYICVYIYIHTDEKMECVNIYR